ncbi:MAG: putative peptide zinc metalloprotease protein [Gaiellaceae bacterium]|nr:putative peptide zinc metalloprotease protein [Gaiellaceae bacterium]
MKRQLLALLITALLAAGVSAARPAFATAGDNAAIAVNTKDGTTVFKVAFAIRHVMNGVVDQTNAAVAYASCTDCAAVAIAFEIVLVESNPTVVTPTNLAIAFNENCTTCVAVAEAYQFVLGTGGAVHFDSEGNKILAEIRKELHSLKKEDLTLAALQAKLDDIAARIADVLANHLVPVGASKETDKQDTSSIEATTTTTPTSTTTPTTTEETTTTTPTTSTTGVTTTSGP